MKNTILNITVILILASGSITFAQTRTLYLVGLPHAVDQTTSTEITKAFVNLLLGAKTGDQIQVFDAQSLARITIVDVPQSFSSHARLRQLATPIAAVRACLKAQTNPNVGIRLPQFLAEMGALPRSEKVALRVIVFGSLFYEDSRDSAASFAPGFVPTDANVSAASERSVYGTADRNQLLRGVSVDFCVLDSSRASELQRRAAERFWAVFVHQLGGAITSITTSPGLAVERSLAALQVPAIPATLDSGDSTIGIRRVSEPPRTELSATTAPTTTLIAPPPAAPDLAIAATPTTSPATAPTVEREVNSVINRVADALPTPSTEDAISIAAVWTSRDNGAADVDLWVRPAPGDQELRFNNTFTSEGAYLRDIRHSSKPQNPANDWQAEWEAVELKSVSLSSLDVWLDLYKNTGLAVQGMVRAQCRGRIVDVPFELTGFGDSAAGRNLRDSDPNWVHIPLGESLKTKADTR